MTRSLETELLRSLIFDGVSKAGMCRFFSKRGMQRGEFETFLAVNGVSGRMERPIENIQISPARQKELQEISMLD